jgi:hypothetical protein
VITGAAIASPVSGLLGMTTRPLNPSVTFQARATNCRYRKLDLGKKRKAHHSVCGSVIASPARKRQRVCFSGVADGADVRRQHLY